ncbi:hypothetical protein FRC17_004148 [Serendipita sp. 399]|nr:hypothetical protein FRC17_004148 [Serendipita sp. 399]
MKPHLQVIHLTLHFALITKTVLSLPTNQSPLAVSPLNPYPNKPKIVFRDDGSFQIMVLSDLHFGENPWDWWGPEQDRKSLILLREVLKPGKGQPDYVIINGDLITGENTFEHNSTLLIDQIAGPINESGIPFSSIHGNHDNQPNITHLAEIEREQLVAPNTYTRKSPPGVGGQGGEGNYWVPVYRHIEDTIPSLVLWCFDSRGGDSPGKDSKPMEDWVHHSVADWIQNETKAMKKAWGSHDDIGALAFVHIPPFLVRKLQANLNETVSPGLNGSYKYAPVSTQAHFGSSADHMGEGSSQRKGKDEAFWNAMTTYIPNLHALVSGHDHGNEWCARERKKGIVFCFAKHSGHGGYGGPGWGFGVRNILFQNFNTTGTIKTWIQMEGGEKKAELDIDETFDP